MKILVWKTVTLNPNLDFEFPLRCNVMYGYTEPNDNDECSLY